MATTNPLFKFGVDIEKTDADGKTMLHRAAMFSDQDKARTFHSCPQSLSALGQDIQTFLTFNFALNIVHDI